MHFLFSFFPMFLNSPINFNPFRGLLKTLELRNLVSFIIASLVETKQAKVNINLLYIEMW